jgi:predicted amidohydrolase
MKICIAQIKPANGDVSANIEAHKRFIELAFTNNAEAIFFPELSLTGYEPELAKKLAIHQNDNCLDTFQEISDRSKIIIGLGLPTTSGSEIRISMIIFEPDKPRSFYSKQELHSDELSFFVNGVEQVIIKTENVNIAPAICYESILSTHCENAVKLGANVYLASVAKSKIGITKAYEHYPKVAKQYSMPVLMANCIGFCDNFLSVGKSAVWTKQGKLAGKLDEETEGILIFDTETEEVVSRILTCNKVNNKC